MSRTHDFPFGIMDVVELLHLRIRRPSPQGVYVDCPICNDKRGKMHMDAEEDKEKEEKFVPKPYTGKSAPKSKKKTEKKKPAPKKDPPKEQTSDETNQLNLFEVGVA